MRWTRGVFEAKTIVFFKKYGDKYDFGSNLNSFIFVSVFGWSYRKGYDVLLKSYLMGKLMSLFIDNSLDLVKESMAEELE